MLIIVIFLSLGKILGHIKPTKKQLMKISIFNPTVI